jgi:serine protease AprX
MPSATTRFKIRFRDEESFRAARAIESPLFEVPVINSRRNLISIQAPMLTEAVREPTPADVDAQLGRYAEAFGAEVVEDYQYALERHRSGDEFTLPVMPEAPGESLDDVLRLIRASSAWRTTRGAGVVIAVVDTGINGTRPEFPRSKRRGQWSPIGEDAWTDYLGHGTMCACIAAGTRASGGEFDGVAPEAGLISCRTHFYDSELATIYDFLGDFAEHNNVTVVATNSFGIESGTPPEEDPNSDFLPALHEAIGRGVQVCFSAGNYHELAGGQPDHCEPTSIWTYKCRDDVLTVATDKTDGSMWNYSSRGPGQLFGHAGMSQKPDVTAPTPVNGRVLYGDGPRSLPEGWGTSGACPQVAGLAALLLSKKPGLTRQSVNDAICNSADGLGHGANCEGSGQINCEAALNSV